MHQMLLLSLLLSQWGRSESQDQDQDQDRDYTVIAETKSWSEAQEHCRRFYSGPASVRDLKDQQRLVRAMDGLTEVWIGLQTKDQDSTWHWSQSGVQHENGDPPEQSGSDDNCAAIDTDNQLIAQPCRVQDQYCFVCYNDSSKSVEKIRDDKNPRSWLQAQKYCRQNHTDLISGWDQLKKFENQDRTYSCWIGLFRDRWVWSDESSSSFRNWIKDTSINPGTGNCTAVTRDGGWKSIKCQRKKSFVCAGGSLVLVKQNQTWEDALVYCRTHYRDLVWNIDSDPWKTQVRDQVQRASTKSVWVGLHFACFFESWFLVNGTYVADNHRSWRNRGKGECGDAGAVKKNGKWINENFMKKKNFICESSCSCCGN